MIGLGSDKYRWILSYFKQSNLQYSSLTMVKPYQGSTSVILIPPWPTCHRYGVRNLLLPMLVMSTAMGGIFFLYLRSPLLMTRTLQLWQKNYISRMISNFNAQTGRVANLDDSRPFADSPVRSVLKIHFFMCLHVYFSKAHPWNRRYSARIKTSNVCNTWAPVNPIIQGTSCAG